METVTPWQCTDEEGKAAVLAYITEHPGADTSDVAEALHLPIKRAFEFTDALVASGEIVEGEV